ncbi:PBSX family phage terminase large subunit [Desulfobacter postgatei]|uniref:PBSX family phage terminase large subunit n=1 Tax=Desulfobacter postgatei TaxID=2293 RepID=UPI00259B5A5E|nr:PBSX family phage terminase large subunit [uncultured Desulfobacter sp.]
MIDARIIILPLIVAALLFFSTCTLDADTIDLEIHDDIYNSVYIPYLDLQTRTQIFYGGSSSGKSFFLAQRLVEDLFAGGHNYLVVRNVGNTLRTSVFNEVKKAIGDYDLSDCFKVNKSDMVITCTLNGYQAIFKGMDDEEKIKSITPEKGVITDIWVEEATECRYEAIKQLNKRLRGRSKVGKRLILSFNPIYKTHWIFTEYFAPIGWTDDQKNYLDDHLSILKTTYADNEWLELDDIYELENENNEYYRNVYTYGKWGVLGDVIITNWRTEDLSGMLSEFTRVRNGLDFGYSSDPNAFTRNHYDPVNKRIYVFSGWHQTKMTNPMIADRIKPEIGQEALFCDSAEPKSIQELKDHGIDARAVKKGPDSLLYSIKWLQRHEIIVDKRLQGMINELTTWQWKKDKDGVSLPIPVDKDNHYIDSTRYALEIEYSGFFGGVI